MILPHLQELFSRAKKAKIDDKDYSYRAMSRRSLLTAGGIQKAVETDRDPRISTVVIVAGCLDVTPNEVFDAVRQDLEGGNGAVLKCG